VENILLEAVNRSGQSTLFLAAAPYAVSHSMRIHFGDNFECEARIAGPPVSICRLLQNSYQAAEVAQPISSGE